MKLAGAAWRLSLASPRWAAVCRALSSAACGPPTDAERVARWQLRLAHDNTFLSYTRNAIIATVAGTAMFQYRKGEGRPPLAAAGLLTMGGLFMYGGSGLYVWQLLRMRQELGIGLAGVGWGVLSAIWPCAVWSASLACLLDETPGWLIGALCSVEHLLPSVVRSSFFLSGALLEPIVRLLGTVKDYEELRLQTLQPQGLALPRSGISGSSAVIPQRPRRDTEGSAGGMLTNRDIATAISQRLERLTALQAKLEPLALEARAIPSAQVVPLIDRLQAVLAQLEVALEVSLQRCQGELPHGWLPRLFGTALSPREQLLASELEAVRVLRRRCEAVKRDSGNID